MSERTEHKCEKIGSLANIEIYVNSNCKWELWIESSGADTPWGWIEIQFCPYCGVELLPQEKPANVFTTFRV